MEYGLISFLPAILVILCAIKTKRTTESLILGVVVSYGIIAIENNENFV